MNLTSEQINFPNQHEALSENVDAGTVHTWSDAQIAAANGANGHGRAVQDLTREREAASANGESVLVLYGTVTGTAETLAKKLAASLHVSGLSARVCDMAQCQPNVLTQASAVLLVASTYGDGEPPDDVAPFYEAVVHGNRLDLTGVKYSVLALGNTTFDHFCKCGRDLDAALEHHGAARLYPRVDCDVDYEGPAKNWMDGVLTILRQE